MNKRINYRDIEGFYTDEGEGQVIILLHGFFEDSLVWKEFKKPFLDNYRMIIPDLPGSGKTKLPNEKLTMEWIADLIHAIVEKEKLTAINLIGHSMGGYVTLAYAKKYPQTLAGIGLFHSHPFADDEEKIKVRNKIIDFIRKNSTSKYIPEHYRALFSAAYYEKNKRIVEKLQQRASMFSAEGTIALLEAMIARTEMVDTLRNFNKPVLFFIGKQDQSIPYMKSLEQTQYPKVAVVHILNEAAHMGMFESTKKTQNFLDNFVRLKL